MSTLNPFENIKPILSASTLIESVSSKAMKASGTGSTLSQTPVTMTRRTEAKRVLTCAKLYRDKLIDIVLSFPNLDEIPEFYIELLDIIFGIDDLRRTLGSIDGSTKVIWKIYREYTSKIWHASPLDAKKARRAAFSRFASVVKKLEKRLIKLEELRFSLRTLPIFDFNDPIIVVAGYPNAGKSSFVKNLTNARPKIANYPFTTQEVTIGHYFDPDNPYIKWQLVDTPGILDRSLETRNDIELRAIVAIIHLPKLILFLFDPTQLESWLSQINLFIELLEKSKTKIIPIINKTDLISPESLKKTKNDIIAKLNINPENIIILQANDKAKSFEVIKQVILDNF